MDLNRVQLIGNVARDPEVKVTPNGQSVATFSMATNQEWKDNQGNKQKRAEFHNIVAWGKITDVLQQYVTKGMKLFLEGRLQTRQWESQDGSKHVRTEIILDNMIMLSQKRPESQGTTDQAPAYQPSQTAPQQEINPADIPF